MTISFTNLILSTNRVVIFNKSRSRLHRIKASRATSQERSATNQDLLVTSQLFIDDQRFACILEFMFFASQQQWHKQIQHSLTITPTYSAADFVYYILFFLTINFQPQTTNKWAICKITNKKKNQNSSSPDKRALFFKPKRKETQK